MSDRDGSELPEVVRDALVAARPQAMEGLERRIGLGRVLAAVLGDDTELPQIGRFVLERKVGSGGMGVVYRARDPDADRPVAIKLLAEDADAERFFREARILADLRHPAVVRYVAHGKSAAGEPYLAMEWLDGEDLGQRLRGAGLTVDETVKLAERLAGALAEAHDRGVVHRDLKPANVFIPGGRLEDARLLDFGVARSSAGSQPRLTRSGVLVGTPSYMSPEQVRGDQDIDGRADVFALGCLVYESLIGRPAFVAEHLLGVLARILFQDPPRVSEQRPEVPGALDELVARMLAKERAARPDIASVASQLAALGHIEGGAPAPSFASPRLSTAETRVVSVVMAASSGLEEEGPLRAAARRFGVSLERVTRHALVAALSKRGPAIDQAADAARLALAMSEAAADIPVVVATGRGVSGGTLPVGDAVDRGAHLLEEQQPGIWLDEITAALLEGRFDVEDTGGGARLVGERRAAAPSRTLLGRATPFVGRDHELSLLDAALADVVERSTSRAVLVTAPSGVGKSRLASEWAARLAASRPEVLALRCRGEPMSAGASFVLAAQLLRRFAGTAEGDGAAQQMEALGAALEDLVDPESRARIATFLGEVLGAGGSAQSEELRAARANPLLMGDQIRLAWEDWLDALASRRPVLVLIEDLQWGDAPSVKLLDTALRSLRDLPLLVVALARPEVGELFPDLWAARGVQTIRLAELSRRASEDLARAVLGDRADPELVSWIGERAGGHALYLEEVIRSVSEGDRDGVPASVLAMVQVRLAALSAEARRVLRAASLFGEVFWRAGVAALLGQGEAEIADVLEDLVSRETVNRQRRPRFAGQAEYRFRHALFREAAEAMLTAEDAILGHRLVAEWLLSVGEHTPRVLAEHFDRGGEPGRAVDWYALATEEALRANDFDAAIELAERGLALGAEGELLGRLQLAATEAHIWRADEADVEWSAEQAIEHLRPGSGRWYDAIRYALTVRVPARRTLLDRAMELLSGTPEDDEARRSQVMALVIASDHLAFHGERDLAWGELGRASAAASSLPPGGVAHAWVLRARAGKLVFDGCHDAALPLYVEAAARFEELGDLRDLCTTKIFIGWLQATALGMQPEAVGALERALELAERVGLPKSISSAKQNLAVALMHTGRLDEAAARLEETVEEFERAGSGRLAGGSRFYLTLLETLRGDVEAAERQARGALELARGVPTTTACSLAAYARALLLAGRNDEALERAREAAAILEELGHIEQGESLILLALAEAQHACGAAAEARETIAAARERLDERAAPMTDPEIRRRFFENVPEHARIAELAAAWGLKATRPAGSAP